jgi:hypothetical protein
MRAAHIFKSEISNLKYTYAPAKNPNGIPSLSPRLFRTRANYLG